MSNFTNLLGSLISLVAMIALMAPLAIYLTLRFSKPFGVTEVDLDREDLPSGASEFFAAAHRGLLDNDFELVGTYFLATVPGTYGYVRLYVNRDEGDTATSSLVASTGFPAFRLCYVEFSRRHINAIVVKSNNSREFGSFRQSPGHQSTQFWRVTDIGVLYRLHHFCCRKYREVTTPVIPLDIDCGGDGIEFIERIELDEPLREQVNSGYLRESESVYAPTIKDAIIMSWAELPPFKQIRRSMRARKARQVLTEARSEGVVA